MRTLSILCFVAACGGAQLEPPLTAIEAVNANTGAALVRYLAQRDASPSVCDLTLTSGPHLHHLTPDARGALVAGFRDETIEPGVWRRCVKTMLPQLPADDRESLVDAMLGAYQGMLGADLDSPARVERLTTLQDLYSNRVPGVEAHPKVVAALLANLQTIVTDKKLGSIGLRFARELLATVELEQGRWQGKPVDAAVLDGLASTGNELTLRRFTERLPTAELREEARRRIVRIHIALSPFPEVREAGPELETTILATGHNAIALADHPVTSAGFVSQNVVARDVIVRQHVWQRTATLVATQGTKVSVVPELALRHTLEVQVAGISRPTPVCGNAKELDPSPCLEVKDISLGQKLTQLDANGVVHVVDQVPIPDLLPIADRVGFAIPVEIGGKLAATLSWGLRFERPEDLVFHGPEGGRGPDVTVRVGEMSRQRMRFDVNYRGVDYLAFVERTDLATYHAGSQGGGGSDGADGSPGSDGSSGSECGDGGNGGDGGDGDSGGDGGNGGDVTVQLACTGGACEPLRTSVRGIVASWGGAGGRGGSGGAGGSGGSGGSGRSESSHTDSDGNTVVDDPGCSAGSSGSSGSSGSDGASGADGRPGRVLL